MPKYIKCPRCDINYITEDKEYCDICEAEMKGIAFDEVIDDEEAELCPKCGINFLNEGEKICEGCQALAIQEEKEEARRSRAEYEWDKEPDEEEETELDEDDLIIPDQVSLEGLAEEEDAWEEGDDPEDPAFAEPIIDELEDIDDIEEGDDDEDLEDDEDDTDED